MFCPLSNQATAGGNDVCAFRRTSTQRLENGKQRGNGAEGYNPVAPGARPFGAACRATGRVLNSGFPDQRQLLAYLTQAQGREARLWRGGQLQVPVPSRGPPGSTVIPLPHARTGRGRVPRAPATR